MAKLACMRRNLWYMGRDFCDVWARFCGARAKLVVYGQGSYVVAKLVVYEQGSVVYADFFGGRCAPDR
ncbi:MAG: hypothetical protein LBL93_06905 [Ruminococcus sp.]|nr:hypothetical protein [Ruminococcus sp.]